MSMYANGVDNNAKQGKCLTYLLMQSILIITKMLILPTQLIGLGRVSLQQKMSPSQHQARANGYSKTRHGLVGKLGTPRNYFG